METTTTATTETWAKCEEDVVPLRFMSCEGQKKRTRQGDVKNGFFLAPPVRPALKGGLSYRTQNLTSLQP